MSTEPMTPKQIEIDCSNLRFYADMFEQHGWSTVVIHSGVFAETLREVAERHSSLQIESERLKRVKMEELVKIWTDIMLASSDQPSSCAPESVRPGEALPFGRGTRPPGMSPENLRYIAYRIERGFSTNEDIRHLRQWAEYIEELLLVGRSTPHEAAQPTEAKP